MSQVDLYWYSASIVDRFPDRDGDGVYDADTCTVNVDLGLRIARHSYALRLGLVDAPEIRGSRHSRWWVQHMEDHGLSLGDVKDIAKRGTVFLEACCPDGGEVLIRTHRDKSGKYGRLVAEIYAPTELVDASDIHGLPPDKRGVFDVDEFQPLTIQANGVTWSNLNLELMMRGLALRAW